jgi:hypothetical protein
MLTDDDLTRELGAAFRDVTADLTYRGRTSPRMRSTAVPVAAAGGLLVAGAVVAGSLSGGSSRSDLMVQHAGPPIVMPGSVAKPHLVTESVQLAGFTMTYQVAKGAPDPVVATIITGGLPSGVREIATPGTKAKAWVGKDPKSGDNALYVKAPTRFHGRIFALLSPSWSQHQLIHLFRSGTRGKPVAVPEVPAREVPTVKSH